MLYYILFLKYKENISNLHNIHEFLLNSITNPGEIFKLLFKFKKKNY